MMPSHVAAQVHRTCDMKDYDCDGWDCGFFDHLLIYFDHLESAEPVVRREDSILFQSSAFTEAGYFSSRRLYSDTRSSPGSYIVRSDESAENCFFYDNPSFYKFRNASSLLPKATSSLSAEADISCLGSDSFKTTDKIRTLIQTASIIDGGNHGYVEPYNEKYRPSTIDGWDLQHVTMPGMMLNEIWNPDNVMDPTTHLQDFMNYGDDLSRQGTPSVHTEMKASSFTPNGNDAQNCSQNPSTLAATQCDFEYQHYYDSTISAIPLSALSQKGAVMSSRSRKGFGHELPTLELCMNPENPCAEVTSLAKTSRTSHSQIRDQPDYAPYSSLPRRSVFDGRSHPQLDLIRKSTSKLPAKDSPNTASDSSQPFPKPGEIISDDHQSKRRRRCRIRDCQADMSTQTGYNKRRRLCKACMCACHVLVDGKAMRYCQQCSQLHRLELFDGQRRSCREKLRHHCRRMKSRKMSN